MDIRHARLEPSDHFAAVRLVVHVPQECLERLGHIARRGRGEPSVLKAQHGAERGLAEPHRLFEHRIEYRGEVAGRGIDDLEDFGGCGLLLQGLAQGPLAVLALGDGAPRTDEAHRPAGRVAHRDGIVLDPAVFAAAQTYAVFAVEARRVSLQRIAQAGAVMVEILGVDTVVPFLARPRAGAGRVFVPAEDLDQPRRHPQRVIGEVPVVDALGDRLGDEGIALLVLTQALLHAAGIGDVGVGQHHAAGGVMLTYTDVTDARRMEQSLRENEERYALVTQAVAEGIYDWNISDNALWVSSRLVEIFGWDEEDAAAGARPSQEWNDRVHPDDFEHYRAALRNALKGEMP